MCHSRARGAERRAGGRPRDEFTKADEVRVSQGLRRLQRACIGTHAAEQGAHAAILDEKALTRLTSEKKVAGVE